MSYCGIQSNHPAKAYPLQRHAYAPTDNRIWNSLQRALAGVALILLSPIVALMWIAVKASSRGPFLFVQERRGKNLAVFKVYKVRTMKPGSEKSSALGVQRSDPSVTPVGRFLRASKLDELPQLWNIVTGEMAIVGPRPVPLSLDKELSEKIPGFEQRYQVRPGLTSLGQICVKDNALGEALIRDWTLRFQGELHYLRNRSVAYDLVMIALTLIFVFRSKN